MAQALFTPPEDELVGFTPPASEAFTPPEEEAIDPREAAIYQEYPDLQPESGPMSAYRKFKDTIAPAAGTALGAWGAGLLATPETVGIGTIPAAIAGGAAGGAGVQWAQDKLMGEEGAKRERAQMELNEIKHGNWSTAGGAIPTMISLLGGGGLVKTIGAKAAEKALATEAAKGLEGAALKGFKTAAAQAAEKAASKHIPTAIAESSLAGARMGAAGVAQRAVQGDDVGVQDFADAMAHDAVAFGPFGVLGHVEGLFKSVGMAVPQAYLSTIAGAAYDSMVHGKPFDPAEVAGKGTAEVIPFAIFNAISHGVAAGQKRLAETAETTPPPPPGAEPVSGTEALHMQGFKEPTEPVDDATLKIQEQEAAQKATALAEQHAQTNAPEDREAVDAASDELADVRAEKARRATSEVVDPVVEVNVDAGNPKTAEALAALPEKLAEQQAIESQRASAEEQAKLAEDAAKEKEKEQGPTAKPEEAPVEAEVLPEIPATAPDVPQIPESEPVAGASVEGEVAPPEIENVPQKVEAPIPSEKAPQVSDKIEPSELTGDKPWELLSFTPQTTTSHDDQQRLDALERGLANDPRTAKLGLVPRAEDARPMEDAGATDSAGPGRGAAALASIEAFAKATGRRVIFISEKDNHPLPFNAVILPEHPDTIFINKNGDRHLLALLGHEWAHTVKITDPELHDAFQKEVLRQLGEKYKAMEEAGLKAKYPLEDLPEEVASNVAGDVFMQPEFWEKLKDHDRPLWERMVDAVGKWLNEMVAKITKSAFGTTEAVQSVEETRQAVLDLMNGSTKQPREPVPRPEEPPSTLNPQPSTPAWGQTVKEMREANAKGVIPAHQVTHDLDDLLSGRKKAIVLNGIKDERAAITLGNTLGFRVAELPNHLGWIGYLEPDAWKPVYDAYAKNLKPMPDGEVALDDMGHAEIAKAMGVDQEQIDDFYRGMLKKYGHPKFQSDKEEDAEDDEDPGRGMTVADIEDYAAQRKRTFGGRPYMNMPDTMSAAHVELLRSPEKPQELADAILTANHKATPREKALMAVAVVQLHNIIEAHPGDPSNIALYDKLDNLYRAYRLDSSSWGQEGNVIQQRIKKDYTPAGLLRRVRMATGKEPTAEMRAKIEQFAKEFAAATEQEKQDAFSYTKKVAHELMEKLEQEQKAREEEGSHWLDSALESLGEEDRGHADAVVGAIYLKQEIAKRRSKLSGLKFSAEGDGKPVEKVSASEAMRLRYADQIKMIESADVAALDKLDQQLSDTLAKAAKHFSDPTTKDAIKKAVGGDKVALKLLDDLSKQPKAKPAKAPDPVKKRFADEVRHPGDATKFAEDMKKLGVKPETAEKLHAKAKEKRETMVKRKFAKDKSSEAAGHERDEESPLSIGEITQALREQGVSHVSEVDASLLEEAMRTLVASGHRGEAEVIPELHKLVAKAGISGDVDEVREAAVKYGAKRRVPSPEELDTALRQVRSEAQKMAQIMHVLHHAELPSGFGPLRDKPHQKLRELYKQLKDVIAKANIKLRSSEAQLASAQDATLTRLRNDIEDLEVQIAAGKRTIRDKNPLAHSPEFLAKHEKLKARKAELQEALEAIAPRKGEDEAERERRLIASAKKVADYWDQRRKDAEWEDKTPNKTSQAVIDARKIAANAKELFEQAKDAARPDFKVGERIDMRKKQIDSLIDKARERLAFGKKQKGNGIYTPEAEASVFAEQQALIDELQRLRVEIEGKPGMSDEQRLKNAENSAQKAIDLLKNQIATNDFTAKDKKNPVGSPKLADLRQELELLREVRDAMKYKERPSDEELAIKRYSRLLERRQADLERRIRDKDFSKVERKKTPENFENEVKKLAIAKLQRRFNTMVKEEVDKNRTPLEKFYDYIPKLKRAFVLSYPAVVGKLTAAAAMRGLTTVSEELVGGALSKVLPKELVRKAEIEGSMLSASGWSKALSRWWDHVGKDVKDTAWEGSSDLDDLFGKGGHESDWWGFFGRIHAALKSPVKRLRFEMAMEKQAEAYARGGGDPTDLITNPLLAAKTGAKAYQAANRDIFLQDNILVDRYTTFVNLLAGAKGTAGPTIARGLRTLLPIVKVPTNIVLETSQHIAGVPIALTRLGHIWKRGMETITPEESESIMRMMKKGSLGAGLMLLGFYAGGPNFAAGSYYSHDNKRKPGDPKVGGFKVFGMDVPTWMTHAPAFEAVQVGATFRRGLNSHQHTKSIPSAALASMVGLAEETPFLNEIFRSKYMTTAKGQEQFIGELAKAQIEPGLISQIAQWTDRSRPLKPADLLTGEGQQKRKPNGFTEIMKSGIPGMRKGLSYTVDSPFSPREEHPPEVLHQYAQKGNPMPTTPTRAPLEKKQGRPISNDIWNAYTDIRGRAVEREMLANIGFLMAPMSEKAKKQKVMEIARKASYEATQALGLK